MGDCGCTVQSAAVIVAVVFAWSVSHVRMIYDKYGSYSNYFVSICGVIHLRCIGRYTTYTLSFTQVRSALAMISIPQSKLYKQMLLKPRTTPIGYVHLQPSARKLATLVLVLATAYLQYSPFEYVFAVPFCVEKYGARHTKPSRFSPTSLAVSCIKDRPCRVLQL